MSGQAQEGNYPNYQTLSLMTSQLNLTDAYVQKKTEYVVTHVLFRLKLKLDSQSAGSSPNLTYTKISVRDAIRIL